jgi:F420 biosynthesis protein FbiB-like protein
MAESSGGAGDFWAALRERRSVRRYADQPVADEVVWRLLEAAHWAPSAHNRQPWRFVWVRSGATRWRLAATMAERWQRDLLALDRAEGGADPEEAARRAAISQQRITAAPVVLVPCLDLEALDRYPDPGRQQAEWQMGVQSVALACQNLLLAAHQQGLGACWMCAPIFCVELVQAVLDLPAAWQPQALLTIGYPPPNVPCTKPREALAERVRVLS